MSRFETMYYLEKHLIISSETRAGLVKRGLPENANDDEAETWIRQNVPGLARLLDLSDFIHGESDRGCAICAASIMDVVLEGLIRTTLREVSSNKELAESLGKRQTVVAESVLDSLLVQRPQPPLGSFSVRIKMVRALGRIDDATMQALDVMRAMRNDAAHLAKPFSFDSPKYKIEQLFGPLSEKERTFLQALNLVGREQPDASQKAKTSRRIFEIAVQSIFFRINSTLEARMPRGLEAVLGSNTGLGPFDHYLDRLMAQSETAHPDQDGIDLE